MKKITIAVIPARGGSKRLPNKNILPFCGEPLIIRTIKVALESNYIDKVVITSDSDKVLEIVSKNISSKDKEIVCIKRPYALATDTANQADVIEHVIDTLGKETLDSIVLLQPTSPLRTSEDVDKAYQLFMQNKTGSVISFGETNYSSKYTTTLSKNDNIDIFINGLTQVSKNSQELEKEYRINGAIYIFPVSEFITKKSIFIRPCLPYIMPYERSFDIDTKVDFDICEYLFSQI